MGQMAKWEYVRIEDLGEGRTETCQMCGTESVRYVHVLQDHNKVKARVGRNCAAKLLADKRLPARKESEVRNKASRKERFLKRWWEYDREKRSYSLKYKGETLRIIKSRYGEYWGVLIGGKLHWNYQGRKIDSLFKAKEAAFEFFDSGKPRQHR